MSGQITRELKAFFDDLKRYGPKRPQGTSLPATSHTQERMLVLTADQRQEAARSADAPGTFDGSVPSPVTFRRGERRPIVAVDCGMIRLGEHPLGILIALRGSLVVDQESGCTVRYYRSGPLFLETERKAETLFALGQQLGQDDYYVEVDRSRPGQPRPLRVRDGVADNPHHYADRFRSWFERKIQAEACVAVEAGTVCFDSSLTLSTRDCPNAYLRGLARHAHQSGNNIIAISKVSELEVAGKSIRWWLDNSGLEPCYRNLTPMIRTDSAARADRIMGNVYAAKFSAVSPSAFRTDVSAAPGVSDTEALERFWASTPMRGRYPDILVRAHVYASFPSSALAVLKAQAHCDMGISAAPDMSMKAEFGPYAGRYK